MKANSTPQQFSIGQASVVLAFRGRMGSVAASWEARTASPDRAAGAFSQAVGQIRSPAGAVVFVSGALADNLEGLARAISALGPKVPVVMVAGGGVLTERGEIEDQAAAA